MIRASVSLKPVIGAASVVSGVVEVDDVAGAVEGDGAGGGDGGDDGVIRQDDLAAKIEHGFVGEADRLAGALGERADGERAANAVVAIEDDGGGCADPLDHLVIICRAVENGGVEGAGRVDRGVLVGGDVFPVCRCVRADGRPWKLDHIKHAMAKAVQAAGLPTGRSFHGLRKPLTAHLADHGASDAEIEAVVPHTGNMTRLYRKQANQKRLASAAIARLPGRGRKLERSTPLGKSDTHPGRNEISSCYVPAGLEPAAPGLGIPGFCAKSIQSLCNHQASPTSISCGLPVSKTLLGCIYPSLIPPAYVPMTFSPGDTVVAWARFFPEFGLAGVRGAADLCGFYHTQ